MNFYISRLNRAVKGHDSDLFVKRVGDQIQIHRKSVKDGVHEIHFVLSLTHNWKANGYPVEWGIEPVVQKLMAMDGWHDDSYYEEMVKAREVVKGWEEQSKRNELKARAMDLRKDFAKATNDINTASL